MSYYGYNIDADELEREKRKERERREKERDDAKLKSVEECVEMCEESSSILNDANENEEFSEDEEPDNEYIEVDCNQCTKDPSSCDKNCLSNLKEEYLATLIEEDDGEYEGDDVEKESNLLEDARKKTLCLEPGLLEKFKKDLEKDDFDFIKKEMIWYSVIFFGTFILGIALYFLSFKFSIKILMSMSMLVLFAQNITNLFWKGKYWNHIRVSLKSKKESIPYEKIVKEVPKYRKNMLSVPIKKKNIVIYSIVSVLSVALLFV